MFGLANMFEFLGEVRNIAPTLQVMGIAVTKADVRKNYFKQTMETLKAMDGIHVFESVIRVDSAVEWSQDNSAPGGNVQKKAAEARESTVLWRRR